MSIVRRDLPEVALCAADCLHPQLAARALQECLRHCNFGDAILFSHQPIDGPHRNVRIPFLPSRSAYSAFILKGLVDHIRTSHVLIVQWDGYVLSNTAWSEEYLRFDYLGAPWPWYSDGMQVGNGGFSLRSSRLLRLTASSDFGLHDGFAEDELACRIHRRALEQAHNIRIAPSPLARRFSYEREEPTDLTFGFHGLFNMWRHVDDVAMVSMTRQMSDGTLRTREYFELTARYLALGKFEQAAQLFHRMNCRVGTTHLRHLATSEPQLSAHFLRVQQICERLTETH